MRSLFDAWSLIVLGTCAAFLIGGLHLPIGWMSVPYIICASLLIFMVFHVNHNQMHLDVFKWTQLNWVYNGVISICIGMPASSLYVAHLINHHPNYCNEKDWTGQYLAGTSKGFWRLLRYNSFVLVNFWKLGRMFSFKDLPRKRHKSAFVEVILISLFLIWICLKIPLLTFFLHYLIPTFLGLNAMIFMNFFVHDGCDPTDPRKASRTFLSFGANFLTLNNGYHAAHHEAPLAHWSDLPRIHATKYSHIVDPRYVHTSALKHFIKYYIAGENFDETAID